MENKQPHFCQSCAMPMEQEAHYGTNADGSKNSDYCTYCYQDGKYAQDCTMEEMIDFCLEATKGTGLYEDRAKAKKEMLGYFPQLKRWAGNAG